MGQAVLGSRLKVFQHRLPLAELFGSLTPEVQSSCCRQEGDLAAGEGCAARALHRLNGAAGVS